MELTIRPIRREEFPLLADFLYDAIYRSDPSSPLPRQIVEHPSLRIYIADFGTLPDDRCLVAQAEGHVVGMVWVRCIRAYGYIGEGIPEFVLSVAAPCRGQGIGTRLMREMLQRLSAAGYPEASLSVQRRESGRASLPPARIPHRETDTRRIYHGLRPPRRGFRRCEPNGWNRVEHCVQNKASCGSCRRTPFIRSEEVIYTRPLYSKPNSSITF